MTLSQVSRRIDAHRRVLERESNEKEVIAWLNGYYVQHAIMSTIGNAMRKDGAPVMKYPPIPTKKKDYSEMSELEKKVEVDRIFGNLEKIGNAFIKKHGGRADG